MASHVSTRIGRKILLFFRREFGVDKQRQRRAIKSPGETVDQPQTGRSRSGFHLRDTFAGNTKTGRHIGLGQPQFLAAFSDLRGEVFVKRHFSGNHAKRVSEKFPIVNGKPRRGRRDSNPQPLDRQDRGAMLELDREPSFHRGESCKRRQPRGFSRPAWSAA